MRFARSNKNKLYKYTRAEAFKDRNSGLERYSVNFLINNRGYNSRYSIKFIKKPSLNLIEKNILHKFLFKKDLYKSIDIVENLKELQSRRGMMHINYLPTRGQRTKTNARTAKNLFGRDNRKKIKKKSNKNKKIIKKKSNKT